MLKTRKKIFFLRRFNFTNWLSADFLRGFIFINSAKIHVNREILSRKHFLSLRSWSQSFQVRFSAKILKKHLLQDPF